MPHSIAKVKIDCAHTNTHTTKKLRNETNTKRTQCFCSNLFLGAILAILSRFGINKERKKTKSDLRAARPTRPTQQFHFTVNRQLNSYIESFVCVCRDSCCVNKYRTRDKHERILERIYSRVCARLDFVVLCFSSFHFLSASNCVCDLWTFKVSRTKHTHTHTQANTSSRRQCAECMGLSRSEDVLVTPNEVHICVRIFVYFIFMPFNLTVLCSFSNTSRSVQQWWRRQRQQLT